MRALTAALEEAEASRRLGRKHAKMVASTIQLPGSIGVLPGGQLPPLRLALVARSASAPPGV